jgi:hypothetical protein
MIEAICVEIEPAENGLGAVAATSLDGGSPPIRPNENSTHDLRPARIPRPGDRVTDAARGRRELAVVCDYDGLHTALRERVNELNISRETLDAVSGIPAGYSGKLLCVPPMRALGRVSFGPVLQSLGLCLIVAEDGDALARVADQLVARKHGLRANARIDFPKWLFTPARAAKCARKRWENVTPAQRSKIARRAIRARWARVRAARREANNEVA